MGDDYSNVAMAQTGETPAPGGGVFPGWVDSDEALAVLERLELPDWQRKGLLEIITSGLTVLPSKVPAELCERTIADYRAWSEERPDLVDSYRDATGREGRLVNFHMSSDAEMEIVTNNEVCSFIDLMFGEPSAVYTSLTFKYGTQQAIHRDTPHFATWPKARFCGAWTALEDVDPSAGPLAYCEGAHRFPIDEDEIFQRILQENPGADPAAVSKHALGNYDAVVITESPNHGTLKTRPIKQGDVLIWHANLPHGGSIADDPFRTRWSVVAHHSPVSVQVYPSPEFFSYAANGPPPPKYGFFERFGRTVASSGDTTFM